MIGVSTGGRISELLSLLRVADIYQNGRPDWRKLEIWQKFEKELVNAYKKQVLGIKDIPEDRPYEQAWTCGAVEVIYICQRIMC